jgi:hypothetical protein
MRNHVAPDERHQIQGDDDNDHGRSLLLQTHDADTDLTAGSRYRLTV